MKGIFDNKTWLKNNAHECTVLLKRDDEFPLDKPCKIALYGNGARQTVKGGTGSGNVYSSQFLSCEEALKNIGFSIVSEKWLDAYDSERYKNNELFIARIKQKAKDLGVEPFVVGFGNIEPEHNYNIPLYGEGDVAVYVLARTSGEGNDISFTEGDALLTRTEIRDILALNDKYDKFMLVLNVGRYVDLTPVMSVKNILLLSQLGIVTGEVLANILLGKSNPSGKLTATWAKSKDYPREVEFGNLDDTKYLEGIYVGYRYFDTSKTSPLFPFGFGLSYTNFEVKPLIICEKGGIVQAEIVVKNVGKYAGKETVQAYVSAPKGKLDKPYQSLVGFAKTKCLKPNEEQTLILKFDIKDIASYFESEGAYILEQGQYVLRVGNSSRNTEVCANLLLDESVIVKRVRKGLLGSPDFKDMLLEREETAVDGNIPTIKLKAREIPCEIVSYDKQEFIHPFVETLSDDELIRLCLGAYKEGDTLSVVGNAGLHVSGAAGETTNALTEKLNGRYLVMADGPAGLRLSPEYIEDENGVRAVQEKLPDGLHNWMPDEVNEQIKKAYELTPKDKIKSQNTTAIPIGTAIAQSWNITFAEECGAIVGEEMEKYNINLLLAPALNIQRSVLCGRNFEYFSEDPYITGKISVAITRGVQRDKNRGVTIKHFVANNQEYNRYNNNSVVSERAMREIYLKGFEICIKESQPFAVMTSYNLLNGTHTSEHKGLIQGILRQEFGFNGLVMSDWIESGKKFKPEAKHPAAFSSNFIKAGNDLTMPGSAVDFTDIKKALKDGKIKKTELKESASRVYEAIIKLKG